MLDGVRPDARSALVLRFLLLGHSRVLVSRWKRLDPGAVADFEHVVARSADDAPPVQPERLLRSVAWRLRRDLSDRGDVADEIVHWVDATVEDYLAQQYDPFDRIVTAAVGATAELYRVAGLTPAKLRRDVPAALSCNSRAPASVDYAKGVTALMTVDGAAAAQVVVKVCPRLFDRTCVLALPYIVSHEYICHAARFALTGQLPSSMSSIFAEGWMDYFAIAVHDRMVTAGEGSSLDWLDPDGHHQCGRRLHDERHGHDDDVEVRARSFARTVAERLDRRLGRRPNIVSPLWRLSATLNGSRLDDRLLDEFVNHVDAILYHGDSGTEVKLLGLVHDLTLSAGEIVERTSDMAEQL